MTSLYVRATPPQARVLRIIEGAVKNACDAHPRCTYDRRMARSIAKRAAGTLTAQWPEVLAARSAPSDRGGAERLRPGRLRLSELQTATVRGAPRPVMRSPLVRLWKQLARRIGEAKRNGDDARAAALIEAIRMVATLQKPKEPPHVPKKPRSNGSETPAPRRAAIGDNVTRETLTRHFNAITGLEAEYASARQALSQAWKDAEADGINKKAAKLAFKQMAADPANADHFVRSFTHYTQQLGLFDKIDAWKQAEDHEANKASVAAASAAP